MPCACLDWGREQGHRNGSASITSQSRRLAMAAPALRSPEGIASCASPYEWQHKVGELLPAEEVNHIRNVHLIHLWSQQMATLAHTRQSGCEDFMSARRRSLLRPAPDPTGSPSPCSE